MGILIIFLLSLCMQTSPIKQQGSKEVFALPLTDMVDFLWNRYVRGVSVEFKYYEANPKILDKKLAQRPATILIHSSESNQGQWLPLLKSIRKSGNTDPLFTFNYKDGDELFLLKQKIEEIRALYRSYGANEVQIHLVGHSLGGIVAVEYAFSPDIWIEGTRVGKVITIASRLKNIERQVDTPYYSYAYPTLKRIEGFLSNIEQNKGDVELFTLAAEKDWLVPIESSLVANGPAHTAIIPDVGHVTVSEADITKKLIVSWLSRN